MSRSNSTVQKPPSPVSASLPEGLRNIELASTTEGRTLAEVRRLPNVLGHAALLEWLGQETVSFQRCFVDIAGGVLPALWLSHAMRHVSRARAGEFEPNGDFRFAMSSSECEAATGLTRAQQAGCRRSLINQGLMSEQAEKRKTIVYRMHLEHIARALMVQAAPLADQLATYEPLPELPTTWVAPSARRA